MAIRLEKMIPLPMLEQQRDSSGIWEAESVVFEQGKSYLIEAPSGRGKTSLLSVIFGIRKDYRGRVFLDGSDISSLSMKEWSSIRKERLSFIFQGLELFDELTALDNILLKNSITRHKSVREIREMAGRLGIDEFLHKKAGILSFGQQQRLAILRSLCQPFRYMLADECFSHMDRKNSMTAYHLIREECRMQEAGLILTSLESMEEAQFDVRMQM
jgi:putative ABC transport system ATP-binding protein